MQHTKNPDSIAETEGFVVIIPTIIPLANEKHPSLKLEDDGLVIGNLQADLSRMTAHWEEILALLGQRALRGRVRRCPHVQITLDPFGDDLRLRRPSADGCGKASPFRRACVLKNLLPAGWKAEPSSLRGGARTIQHWPESRRLSAQRGGRAALCTRVSC